MMQSINNQLNIKKESIAADGRNGSLKQDGTDFLSTLSALYSVNQNGENSSLRAVYNSIQHIRDRNDGYAGGVDASRYSSVLRVFDRDEKRQHKDEFGLRVSESDRSRSATVQSTEGDAKKAAVKVQKNPEETKTHDRPSRPMTDEKVSSDDELSCSTDKGAVQNKGTETIADFLNVNEQFSSQSSESAQNGVTAALDENEKLLLTTAFFAEESVGPDETAGVSDSADMLKFSCPNGENLSEESVGLSSLLYKNVISTDGQKTEQASRQMAMMSDDSLEVDLNRIIADLQHSAQTTAVEESSDAAEDMAKLVESSGVTSISLQSSESEVDLDAQLASMEELQNIDDSLKLARVIRTQNDQHPGDDSDHGQHGAETLNYGQALKTLREATGQEIENLGVDESAESNLKTAVTEQIPTAEHGNVNASRQVDVNSFSFGQSVTNELNSAVTGGKETALNDLLSLSSDLRKNAEELIRKVMEMAARNLRQMELNLNPESLGKMRICIDLSGTNEITRITVAASEAGTRDLIAQTLGRLREQLELVGSEVETALADYQEQSGENGFAQNDERSAPNEDHAETVFADNAEKVSEDDKVDETQINSQNGERVSYFA